MFLDCSVCLSLVYVVPVVSSTMYPVFSYFITSRERVHYCAVPGSFLFFSGSLYFVFSPAKCIWVEYVFIFCSLYPVRWYRLLSLSRTSWTNVSTELVPP